MTTQGQIDLTSKVVVEGMKLGKSAEEIGKLVAIARLTLPPPPIEEEEVEEEQLQVA